jgi:hypothetical protein
MRLSLQPSRCASSLKLFISRVEYLFCLSVELVNGRDVPDRAMQSLVVVRMRD